MKKNVRKKDLTYNQAFRLHNLPRLVDTDKDGVLNMFDCHPFDPNRDGLFGRAVNVVTRGKYGQSKEDYEKEKFAREQSKIVREQAKLDKGKEEEEMPRKPVYNAEHEYHAEKMREEEKKEAPKRKSSEPYVVYVKHGITEPYVLVGQFESSWEAHKHFDENYKGFAHKIMSVSDAVAEGKRLEARAQKRKEMISKAGKTVAAGAKVVGRGAVAVGRGAAKATEAVGKAEEKYQEYWEKRDIKQAQREERELERLRRAQEREQVRLEREELLAELREQAEQREHEKEMKRLRTTQQPQQPTSQSRFQPPTQQGFRGSRLNIQSPFTQQQRPFGGPQLRKSPITIQAPKDIRWKPYQPPQQPKNTPVKKKSKGGKKK